jgi:hypothetical protein
VEWTGKSLRPEKVEFLKFDTHAIEIRSYGTAENALPWCHERQQAVHPHGESGYEWMLFSAWETRCDHKASIDVPPEKQPESGGEEGAHDNNTSGTAESESQASKSASVPPSLPSQHDTSLHLVRCTAISRSTREQCKHHVSFRNEIYCPSHGGLQIAPLLPLLPQCQAMARITRVRCEKRVSIQGEVNCPAHGGLKKTDLKIQQMQRQATQPTRPSVTVDIPWHAIHAVIIAFLIDDHSVSCNCTPNNRCQALQSISSMLSFMGTLPLPPASGMPSQETIAEWFQVLGEKPTRSPSAFWFLSIFQVIASASVSRPPVPSSRSTAMPQARAAAGTPVTSPPLFEFRDPSDLDSIPSFLNMSGGLPQ